MKHTKSLIVLGMLVTLVAGGIALRTNIAIPKPAQSKVSVQSAVLTRTSPLPPQASSKTESGLREAFAPSTTSKINRQKDFYQASNLYPFIRQASIDAIKNHDGRAAYFVSEALRGCAMTVHLAKIDPSFEENFDITYAQMAPHAPEWARAKARRDFDRCTQVAKEDPFDELPIRPEGYRDADFWNQLAIVQHDPLAEAHQAYMDVIGGNPTTPTQQAILLAQAQTYIEDATKSGDPTALFLAGQLLSSGKAASDPLRGVGISLAACDLGYDCSANNLANSFAVCKENGLCPADADYSFYMQTTLGARDFAIAYRNAQSFKDLLTQNDLAGLNDFVRLDGAMARN